MVAAHFQTVAAGHARHALRPPTHPGAVRHVRRAAQAPRRLHIPEGEVRPAPGGCAGTASFTSPIPPWPPAEGPAARPPLGRQATSQQANKPTRKWRKSHRIERSDLNRLAHTKQTLVCLHLDFSHGSPSTCFKTRLFCLWFRFVLCLCLTTVPIGHSPRLVHQHRSGRPYCCRGVGGEAKGRPARSRRGAAPGPPPRHTPQAAPR